jgi:hypothetical protein
VGAQRKRRAELPARGVISSSAIEPQEAMQEVDGGR